MSATATRKRRRDDLLFPAPRILAGLGHIIDSYDAMIVDLWGVTHNGRALFPQAIAAFELAKARGVGVIFLSNAPRRESAVMDQLDQFGLDRSLYQRVVTSGELAWEWMGSAASRAALGPKCYHLGAGEKDANMRVGLDISFTDSLDQASFVLNTGPEDAITTLDSFADMLAQLLTRSLPMVCANPDLSVFRGSSEELCAGAIAQEYEQMGGCVHWFGKPKGAVYARCLDLLDPFAPNRVLCIGDSMRTDIMGARTAGLDCLLVGTGLRRQDFVNEQKNSIVPDQLNRLCEEYSVSPTYACVALKP